MEKQRITLEFKAAYFAQYWGQEVNVVKRTYGSPRLMKVDGSTLGYLKLTALDKITDDDAFRVVELVSSLGIVSTEMRDPQKFLEPMKKGEGTTHKIADVIDYLRSKGYAVPFRGYTVEQLIELGVLKIKP